MRDSRLDKEKEPSFVLVPEPGGGYKCTTPAFNAHISSRGDISFKGSPVGFQKGKSSMTIYIGDIITRAKGATPMPPRNASSPTFPKSYASLSG